ncbi:MAG: hypothetical protein NC548_33660 [Lachnospiraceae bacterium]|nr:hypothetical protein [Lachnospiraceae bacterium]
MSKEKVKTIVIALLSITLVILCIFLFTGKKEDTNISENELHNTVITTQPTTDNLVFTDDNAKVKEEVCKNFLTAYYTVYHAKSKLVNLPECKKYITDYLYSSLLPNESSSSEYSADEVDIDYSSSITINQSYQDINNPDKLLISCTIKKTVNDLQSINDYYILFYLDESDSGWLINQFELISQGA